MTEEQIYQVIGFPDKYTVIINAGKHNSDSAIDDEARIYETSEDVTDINGTFLGNAIEIVFILYKGRL